jgi:hypothetical protein
MKKQPAILPILVALALSWGACKKQLNVFPTTSQVDGNLITDQQSAQLVLNGVYYRFADAKTYGNGIFETDWSDNHEDLPSLLAGTIYSRSISPAYSHTLSPSDSYTLFAWNYGYNLVNAANGFLANMAPVTSLAPAIKQQMLAEARFLRAFGNAELLFYFGQYTDPSSKYGIILRDTVVAAGNINTPRSGVAAAYTAILSDLDAAIPALPALNSALYYTNAAAAKLLKARVLMNRGAAGDYAEVITLTKDCIANSPFALEDSLKDLFLTKGFAGKEVMLGIQPYPNEDYKFSNYQGGYNDIAADSLVALLIDDTRNQWVFKVVDDPYNGPYDQLTKYFSGDPSNPIQTPLSSYGYAFRLSEAYLLEAEAITLSTGDLPAARTLLTTVMSHAGAGPTEMAAVAAASTPEKLQLEIVKENLRNFVAENGVDWLALRRLPFTTIQQMNPNITSPAQLILPIPSDELKYNNTFQNLGY